MPERRDRLGEAEELTSPEERDGAGPASETPASPAPREDPADEAAETLPQSPASPAPALGAPEPLPSTHPQALRGTRRRALQEKAIAGLLFLCSAVSILTTLGIVGVLLTEAAAFFRHVPIREFLLGTEWTPLFTPQRFGVVPLLAGSFLVALGAALVALPLGLLSAIYLSEYAPDRVRSIVKPALEVLAGVPTVVYGYFALTFVTPIIRGVWPETSVFNAASAALVVGIMIVPMVSSLSEDAMSAVPRALREGAYALGATRFEVAVRTVVPAALSGILASFILAISRAIGETMVVTIAAGATPNLTLNPLESVQTMTAYIAQIGLGEVPYGTVEYRTIFAVGLALFVVTLLMNVVSGWVLQRYREVYE